ncbi:hypothetical protein D3C73_1430530 [compost metagenome]
MPTRLKVYRRGCWSTLDTPSKLPLPSRSMRTILGRPAKLLPIELSCRNGFCARRMPSSWMIARVLSVPISRLLNSSSKYARRIEATATPKNSPVDEEMRRLKLICHSSL